MRTNVWTHGTPRRRWENIIEVKRTETGYQGMNRVKMKFIWEKFGYQVLEVSDSSRHWPKNV